ncbi:MAG: ankyrin repeat domain-containing protein [Bacteroidota bacterium]
MTPAGGNWKELYNAAQAGNLALVKYHTENGIDIDYQHPEFLTTPLIASIEQERYEIAHFLLQNGASPTLKEIFGAQTPLLAAKATGNTRLVELIRSFLPKIPPKGLFITGHTGLLGQSVIRALEAKNWPITVGSRKQPLSRGNLGWQHFDLDDRNTPQHLNGCDTLLHLATNTDPKADSDIRGCKQLLSVARKENIQKIIYISIVGVDQVPLKYFKNKQRVEQLIQSSGIPYSILRATQFHAFFEQEVKKHLHKSFIIIPDLLYQPIATKVVAQKLIDLCQQPPINDITEIGGPTTISYRAAIQHYLTLNNQHKKVFSIPNFLLGKLGKALTTAHKVRGGVTWYDYLESK